MMEKASARWFAYWRNLRRQPRRFRLLAIISGGLFIIGGILSFVFTGPANPFLPAAWRARLAAARLAEAVSSSEICHESCLRERLVWRQAVIAYGTRPLFIELDKAVSDNHEDLDWRIEALTILSKIPGERLPENLVWPAALAAGAPPELAAAAWRLFPSQSDQSLAAIVSAVENGNDDKERLAALRLLLRNPEALPAVWYLDIAEKDKNDKLRLAALQALANFTRKTSVFDGGFLDRTGKLWSDNSLPLHAKRLLVMLMTDYGGIDKAAAQKQLKEWLSLPSTDNITKVFIAENLRRYFGLDVAVPAVPDADWEAYNQADPFIKP